MIEPLRALHGGIRESGRELRRFMINYINTSLPGAPGFATPTGRESHFASFGKKRALGLWHAMSGVAAESDGSIHKNSNAIELSEVTTAETLEVFCVHALLGRPIPLWKRAMDVFGASVGLILLSPIFVFTALLILIVSPGPVFFSQNRVGYRGKIFRIWKFRTMRIRADEGLHESHVRQFIQNNPNAAMQKISDDPRIIPFGKILRKTAIDELPQLFNVLIGDMSMVGPRPEMTYAAGTYDPWPTMRFDVTPGMTGLWQVSGKNKTTYHEMMRLDIRYVRMRSFALDLKIIAKTFPVLIGQALDKTVRS